MKFLFLILIFLSAPLHARVFNVNETSFATYFKANYSTSAIGKDPYDKSSGAQTVFSEDVDSNWGGELGFAFPSPNYAFRLGLSIIAPSSPSGIKGTDAAGTTEYMSLDSRVLGLFPIGHYEYYMSRNAYGRTYISLGAGYGKVSLSNDYTVTAAGIAQYPGSASFSETASQYTYIIETAVGYEMSFSSAVTLSFDLGYRYCSAKELEYDSAGNNFNGAHSAGDPVLNSDGTEKTLDLGGVFAGLSFRFYFN